MVTFCFNGRSLSVQVHGQVVVHRVQKDNAGKCKIPYEEDSNAETIFEETNEHRATVPEWIFLQ